MNLQHWCHGVRELDGPCHDDQDGEDLEVALLLVGLNTAEQL